MVQANPHPKTFDDFLVYTKNIDGYYELTNGELVPVPPESDVACIGQCSSMKR